MNDFNCEKILGSVAAQEFVGRASEAEMLLSLARGGGGGEESENAADDERKFRGLALLSAPALGASELLRQTYDRIFAGESRATIPVYFALKKSDKTARRAAERFKRTFLRQTLAFERRDAKILNCAAPDSSQISESEFNDERDFIKNRLSAPIFAAEADEEKAENVDFFVMFDHLHEVDFLTNGVEFVEQLTEIFGRAPENVRFVFAGHRRFLYGAMKSGDEARGVETIELAPLDFADAGRLTENLARRFAVEINDQTRDLIALQTAGNLKFVENLFRAAKNAGKINLDNFRRVEQIYAEEIFGGAICRFYDALLARIAAHPEIEKNIVGLLYDCLTNEKEKSPVESWKTRAGFPSDPEFYRAVRLLNHFEIVRRSSNFIEAMSENEVLNDYIKARFRLETNGEPRALVVAETLSEFLRRAPQAMARFYRKQSAIGLRELLSAFACQRAPAALLDYSIFAAQLKGASEAEISERLAAADTLKTERIELPQVVYAAHADAFYPPISQVAERERTAVALAFQECKYTDDDEVIWIAAEIDSKLEAGRELAEFWCDRLEMVALSCNFLKYKIWLIAPEGFAPDALEILKQRNAFGSSRRQAELLAKFLNVEEDDSAGEKFAANQYEMVVPMGEDTELIAAHAVEEIARRHSFTPKAINQIKTALVEACINATEHSLSPDRRIYQKFTVESDKIIITVANRGLRLADRKAVEIAPDEGRRGWGLRLIKTLMDEVKFEQADDGTRISMVKYLTKKW